MSSPPSRSSSRPRRGLTLLEVLLASAILAMLAAACAPTIARAMTLLRHVEPVRSIDIIDLADVADEITVKPESVGLGVDGHAPLYEVVQLDIPWPATDDVHDRRFRPPIRIRCLPKDGTEPSADHVWIAFECDGLTVYRWQAIPDAPEKTATGGD